MGRSSDSRIFLLAAPSRSFEKWHPYGFRPRSQRRVRNGFTPFSLKSLTDNPRIDSIAIIAFLYRGSQVKILGHSALIAYLVQLNGGALKRQILPR